MSDGGQAQFINPEDLHRNPAFTNVVAVTGPVKMVFVGGQDSVDKTGTIVGKGDLRAQTEQVLKNIRTALAAAGAEPHHVIKWSLFVVQGQDLRAGFQAFQSAWEPHPNPPAITMAFVSALANPDFLIEMDAIAVVPT